jgi:Tfp pilus assembly protein PilV
MKKTGMQAGFVMAEVILAVMIIATALLATAGMFIQSVRSNNNAAQYTVATNLAQKQIELLKLKSHNYWSNQSMPAELAWQDNTEALPVTVKGVHYYVTTTATTSTEDSNLTEIVVVVYWSRQGQVCDVRMTSFFSKLE